MRISRIEIKDFRAFSGEPLTIDLTLKGKNLLVYGENGSGKSSLYLALKDFLECAAKKHDILKSPYRNIFVKTKDAYVKLTFNDPNDATVPAEVFEWSHTTNDTANLLILEVDKAKGFLDYKALLRTYFLQQERDTVNIFDLLIKGLLAGVENDLTGRTFGDEWELIQKSIPKKNTEKQIRPLSKLLTDFNDGLRVKLDELKTKVGEMLGYFGYQISVDFVFAGVSYNRKPRRQDKGFDNCDVGLKVTFFTEELTNHHHLLNEAKLSAIAIAIFLAALTFQPSPSRGVRILALDDVLIGLDMSNRLPVLEILHNLFADYQIFFITYDRAWYEIVKQRIDSRKEAAKWKYVEFFSGSTFEHELPIYAEDKKYLDVAKAYLAQNDYKAAVIYLRTHFEKIIKNFCDNRDLRVRYKINQKQVTGENFWKAVLEGHPAGSPPFVSAALATQVETYRKVILNPLSHPLLETVHRREVEESITTIETLETELRAHTRVRAATPAPPAVPAASATPP